MSKKEKLHFSHGENFESVEDLLATAMDKLDEANTRIQKLLESDTRDIEALAAIAEPEGGVGEEKVEGEAPSASAEAEATAAKDA